MNAKVKVKPDLSRTIGVYADHQRRTCIVVNRDTSLVDYIQLDTTAGLVVQQASITEFDAQYKLLVNYPMARACQLYAGYAKSIGASPEALAQLGKHTPITPEEITMATKRQASKSSAPTGAKPTTTTKPAGARPKGVKPKGTTKPAKPAGAKVRKPSAAQLFQELIVAGKLTDDQIFAEVKKRFGLDDKKRGYVAWYRNHLKKTGKLK